MGRTGCFLVGVMAAGFATVAMLAPSEARPRFGPRAVFGILGAPLGMFRRVIRPRVHRPHPYPHAGRSRALTRAARPGAALALAVPTAWAGSLFWPHGFGDAAAYAVGEPRAAARFWGGGFADVLAGLVAPAVPEAKVESRRRGVAAARLAEGETTGAAATPPSATCPASDVDALTALARRLEERLAPKPGQEAVFAAFRQALATAGEDLGDSCPPAASDDAPASTPARLAAMRERLWAIQSAALALRGPFADLYDALDDTQKKTLDGVIALAPAADAAKMARRGEAPVIAAQICHMQAQAAAERTATRIRAAVTLTPGQEAPFRTLTETSAGMAKLAVASCPAEPPGSALARFDAVLSRLDAMLYAIVVVATPLDVFYGSLSEEQKARFDALGGRVES
ncbi:Spy/CpxP family protein refolding chaperone [Xanthobacteraceae bacterium Astr-EGSB]|uniref:Spy/CpxP family protein refolding chaperone n=1 Tax=Astrobacterium formosum TaxID=3069710 RepID=UPI0027B260CC|nr:Spy/CpxP family protein refolding chaperone [Xanthobacteraceae bacterium Astr-EGSB]